MSTSERGQSGLPPALRARVLAEIAKTPAPTRRQHRAFVAIVGGAAVVATTVLFFVMGGFARGARPMGLVVFTAGFGLLAAVVLTRVAVRSTGSMLGPPSRTLALASTLTAPALALVAGLAAAFWPEHAAEGVPTEIHFGCGLLTIVQGILPLIAFVVAKRRTDPLHPALTGAALGMAAGAWAATMAYLRCPHAEAVHGVAAHVVPTLLLIAAGALLGRALLAIRRAPAATNVAE